MSAPMGLSGHMSNNSFKQIVALQNPLKAGGGVPAALGYYGYAPHYSPPSFQAFPPFSDTSTQEGAEPTNAFLDLYVSFPDKLFSVFIFPNVLYSGNTAPP
jgi:hypothetical protein